MFFDCNCKINIGLQVTGKRPDGYHDLRSFFYPVPFGDRIEVFPANLTGTPASQRCAPELRLELHGIPIPGAQENILQVAYRNLQRKIAVPPVSVRLYKRVPPGTGLGGSSSSAAHFLKAMKELFNLPLSEEEMLELALQTGSDCPFFMGNGPALVSGRGEVVTAYPDVLRGYHLVILYAGIRRSTQEAFAGLQLHGHEERLEEILCQPPGSWAGRLKNDFEEQALRQFPVLEQQRQRLYQSGALYASLSGSGSCMFGIFQQKPQQFFEDSLFQGIL